MKKFKLTGEQLYKRHAISVIMEAMRSGEPGNFMGEGLNLRWLTLKESLVAGYKISGPATEFNNFDPTKEGKQCDN